MKRIGKWEIVMIILAVIPFVITAFMFDRLADKVPTHWGLYGDVTYGDKNILWFLSSLPAAMAVLIKILPKIDPKKRNYASFGVLYDAFIMIMMLFMTGILVIVISESLNPGRIAVSKVVVGGIGLLYAFLGYMMPKIKSNFFMGIKTPWTLSSTAVWDKTHRLAGYLWLAGGIASFVITLLLNDTALFAAFITITIAIAAIPTVMSFVWYKKYGSENKEE